MDFDLTEEQSLLQDTVAKLLADAYSFDQRKAMRALPGGYDRATWQQFADLGLLALPFAEADGGLGGGAVDVMLLMEAFGRSSRARAVPGNGRAGGRLPASRRHAEATRGTAARPDLGRDDVCVRACRAWSPLRSRPCHDHGSARRCNVGSRRLEGIRIARRQRRAPRGVGVARSAGVPGAGLGLFVVDASSHRHLTSRLSDQDGLRAADLELRGVSIDEAAAWARPTASQLSQACRRSDRRRLCRGRRHDGACARNDGRLPQAAQTVRRRDRHVPGAAASGGRHARHGRAGTQHGLLLDDDGRGA